MTDIIKLDLTSFREASMEQQQQAVDALERGDVLLLPKLPFELQTTEMQFLTANAVTPKRKNISYDCRINQLKGDVYHSDKHQALQAMMMRFAESARSLVVNLFPGYSQYLQQARTSYRPVEAFARTSASERKDDRLLHVDAFPANPTQGKRILRVFSNINQSHQPRVWRLGERFEQVAKHFLPELKNKSWVSRKLLKTTKVTKSFRTKYDELMLQLHDKMKADEQYQQAPQHQQVELPANSTWMVFTDQVPHAVLSGQFCLEQTFHFPVAAMQYPERSPLQVLENLVGKKLV